MSDQKPKKTIAKTLKVKEKNYETDYRFKTREAKSAFDVRSTAELMAFLESDAGKDVEVEAKVISFKEGEGAGYRKLSRKKFIESYKDNNKLRSANRGFREAFDGFTNGGSNSGGFSNPSNGNYNTVGNDFTPLLGGPFYKQLYYWDDFLRQHQDAFFAYHHDPMAKSTVNIIVNFTLGKGYKLQCENNAAQAVWDAFEEVNELQAAYCNFAKELSVYGENMWWWLPNNQKYIEFPNGGTGLSKQAADVMVQKCFLPRIRLVDPSNFVEIVTHPEDITNRLFYVWCTPTQYQIYTGKDDKTGKVVDSTKMIYQQIPADQIMHVTVNSVSNEKRGRSDLFAALSYYKRLRDSVNYAVIKDQKNAAWSIDTTIEGDETDLNNYVSDQEALGTIPPAGSEFAHTAAIKREYLANQGQGSGKGSMSFEWCMNMSAMGSLIPVSYYGTNINGGQTRAGAIVATEPVAKMFEMRQDIYSNNLRQIAKKLFKIMGITPGQIDISFPEIITQDRSAKLKDLTLAETNKWISPERAANDAASELGYDDYDYSTEKDKIAAQQADEIPMLNPLTAPPGVEKSGPESSSAVTKDERKGVSDSNGY